MSSWRNTVDSLLSNAESDLHGSAGRGGVGGTGASNGYHQPRGGYNGAGSRYGGGGGYGSPPRGVQEVDEPLRTPATHARLGMSALASQPRARPGRSDAADVPDGLAHATVSLRPHMGYGLHHPHGAAPPTNGDGGDHMLPLSAWEPPAQQRRAPTRSEPPRRRAPSPAPAARRAALAPTPVDPAVVDDLQRRCVGWWFAAPAPACACASDPPPPTSLLMPPAPT